MAMIIYTEGTAYFLESSYINFTDFLNVDFDWFPTEVAMINLTLWIILLIALPTLLEKAGLRTKLKTGNSTALCHLIYVYEYLYVQLSFYRIHSNRDILRDVLWAEVLADEPLSFSGDNRV